MPEIEIRPIKTEDVEYLSEFEHGFYSEYVWQMSVDITGEKIQNEFRRVRLPRRVFVPYPRPRTAIFNDIDDAEAFLVAVLNTRSVGYIKVQAEKDSNIARVTDLVVTASIRRQGIASGLMLAVMDLVAHRKFKTLILEIQSKNDPAIKLANKLGFNYCGFRDQYFPNQELAMFFSRIAR